MAFPERLQQDPGEIEVAAADAAANEFCKSTVASFKTKPKQGI